MGSEILYIITCICKHNKTNLQNNFKLKFNKNNQVKNAGMNFVKRYVG